MIHHNTQPADVTPLYAAQHFRTCGFSVIAVRADGSKKSAGPWKAAQSQRATEDQLNATFGHTRPIGLAVACGGVSGNLLVLDFDEPDLHEEFERLLEQLKPGLLERLAHVQTPRGNTRHYHLRYETPGELIRNMPLAKRSLAAGDTPLVETRGEGGYVLLPGSSPECHATGRRYEHVGGVKFRDLKPISWIDLQDVLTICRSLSLVMEDVTTESPSSTTEDGDRPGDAFNRNADWFDDVLGPHGWKVDHVAGGRTYWRRPGKGTDHSATTGSTSKQGTELFINWSTSAAPFDIYPAIYSKFAAYALLNHGGDYSAAALDLANQGYGQSVSSTADKSTESNETAAAESTTEPAQPLFTTWADVIDDWSLRFEKGEKPRLFDVGLNLEIGPGLLTILGGGPGSGKTTLALQMVTEALQNESDVRALYLSVEVRESDMFTRQLAIVSGVACHHLRYQDELTDAEFETACQYRDILRNRMGDRLSIINRPYTMDNVAAAVKVFDANLLVLDYVQRIPPTANCRLDAVNALNASFDRARAICDGGVAVISVSALNRPEKRSKQYEDPGMTSFRGSSELEYGGDECWAITRKDRFITLKHLKARFRGTTDIELVQGDSLKMTDRSTAPQEFRADDWN